MSKRQTNLLAELDATLHNRRIPNKLRKRSLMAMVCAELSPEMLKKDVENAAAEIIRRFGHGTKDLIASDIERDLFDLLNSGRTLEDAIGIFCETHDFASEIPIAFGAAYLLPPIQYTATEEEKAIFRKMIEDGEENGSPRWEPPSLR